MAAAGGEVDEDGGGGAFLFQLLQMLEVLGGGSAPSADILTALGAAAVNVGADELRPASASITSKLPRVVLENLSRDLPSVASLVAIPLDSAGVPTAAPLDIVAMPAAFSPPLTPAHDSSVDASLQSSVCDALARADTATLPRLHIALAGGRRTGFGWPSDAAAAAAASGCAVFFDRGDVSFARKVLLAGAAHAAAVIIAQSVERAAEWPLTAVDGAGECVGTTVPPTVMVSAAAGESLRRLAATAAASGGSVAVSLFRSAATSDCAVCCESYALGDAVISLPCLHVFHEKCVLPWLARRNTCPCCRFELPLDPNEAAAAAAERARAEAWATSRRLAAEREAAASGLYG